MPASEIDDLKNCFIEKLSPEGIYLFGSFAEGRQREDSDFDFYIVVGDSCRRHFALGKRAAAKGSENRKSHNSDKLWWRGKLRRLLLEQIEAGRKINRFNFLDFDDLIYRRGQSIEC